MGSETVTKARDIFQMAGEKKNKPGHRGHIHQALPNKNCL